MDHIKKIARLNRLANELDDLGLTKEANFVDYLIAQLAPELKPIGEVFEKDGKQYRKFMNAQKILVVKEVDRKGMPLQPTPSVENTPEEPYFWEKWVEKYNPFSGLMSGLSGQPEKAKKEQEASEVPWIEKTKNN